MRHSMLMRLISRNPILRTWHSRSLVALATCLLLTACQGQPAEPVDPLVAGAKPKAEYDKQTGKLQALVSDRDGDGKPDAWLRMDGARLKTIERDENGDGQPDRWEYYAGTSPSAADPVIERAEESGRFDGRITRREFYTGGELEHVEDDVDADGRPDKWEYYEHGAVARLELDLQKKGFPDRRLVYRNGRVEYAEGDPDGDGKFEILREEPPR